MSHQRLIGRRIVITGAASGIGRATAELFASEGATLVLLDRNAQSLEGTARSLNAFCHQVDVADEQSVSIAVERGAEAIGGIDGVVNAAGIQIRGSVLEVDAAEWRRTLDVNLTGTYIVVRSCLPWMTRNPGTSTIVNIASGQALLPNAPNRTAYAASKGGVLNLTRALAAELAPLRANCVCPGLVDTPMAEGVQGNVGNYALRRLAKPDEIGHAILFLTSAESSYVTGAALAVDGGRSFH